MCGGDYKRILTVVSTTRKVRLETFYDSLELAGISSSEDGQKTKMVVVLKRCIYITM